MERNLTEGPLLSLVIRFSLPFLFSYFLQTLYGLCDLLIVGLYYDIDSITSVSIGSQVMHMITGLTLGLSMGATVVIAQAVGRREKENTARAIGNTIILFALFSVFLTLLLFVLSEKITNWMSTPAESRSGTLSYLKICFSGLPFIVAYNVSSSVFRGLGDSKPPLYSAFVACLFNILLDFLFVGKLSLGAPGAAYATVFAQVLASLLSVAIILKRKIGITLRFDKKVLGDITRCGVPIAFQEIFIQLSFIAITVIVNRRGLKDAAAVAIVEKIMTFLFLLPSAALSTISAIGAQNIAAGKEKRAKKALFYVISLSVLWSSVFVIFFHFNKEKVISLFTLDSAVIILASSYISSYIYDNLLGGIHFSFSGYFSANKRSGLSFLHNILSICIVRIPGALYASHIAKDTLFPLGLASTLGSLFSVFICLIFFIRLNKKEKVIL